ncbi:MAG: right-handed parallel beta-helix repeat-containing protein [Dysgonamonadaceae bacterium]
MKKQITNFLFTALLLLAGMFSFSAEAAVFVKADAVGGANGTSWNDAYTNVAEAIAAAQADDEIWIAAGTYGLTTGITVDKALSLYGGFAGTETSIDDRAKVAGGEAWEFQNPTVLKATAGMTILKTTGTGVTVTLDGITFDGDNISGTRGIDAQAVTLTNIVRCIVRNNNINAAGVGIYGKNKITVDASLVEDNVSTSTSGKWGGAIAVLAANSSVKNSLIQNNSAKVNGGGIGIDNVGGIVISNCRIIGNTTTVNGGGIVGYKLSDVHNCWIEGNTASRGGGIYCRNYAGTDAVYNNIIVGNTATATGLNAGAGICGQETSDKYVKFYNNIVAGNIGGSGLYSAGYSKIVNNLIYENKTADGTLLNVVLGADNGSFANNIYDGDNANIAVAPSNCIIETVSGKLFTNFASGDYTPPATGFAGFDKGIDDLTDFTFADNLDYAGNARVQGQSIDIGAYEQVSLMRQLTVNINGQIESSTLQSQEFSVTVGVGGTYSFTLKPGAHSPLVFLAGTKLGVTESGGAYSYTLPGITENATVQIAAFAANVLPVSEDTYQRRNGNVSGDYANEAFLGSRGEAGGYAIIPLLNFAPTVSQKVAGYNKATLKLVPKETFTIDYTVRQFPSGQFANINVVGAGDYNELMKAPAVGSTQTIVNTANAPSLFDVTDNYVLNAMPAEITLSLIKASNGTTHSFYSLENGNIDYIPVLLFENTSYEITVNATNVTIVSPTLSGGKFTTTGLSQDITFTVEDGYENPVVKVDDVDYTLGAPVNDVYTLSLTGILSNKNVVITASPKSGSSLTDKDADKVSVRYVDGRLLIENAKVGSRIQLSNLAGICLWEQTVSSSSAILDCPLKAGVYLLKTGETTQKILVK